MRTRGAAISLQIDISRRIIGAIAPDININALKVSRSWKLISFRARRHASWRYRTARSLKEHYINIFYILYFKLRTFDTDYTYL